MALRRLFRWVWHISQRLLAAQKRAIRHIEDPARVRTHTKPDMIQWNLSNLGQNSQRIPLYAVAKQQAISGLVVQSFSSPRALGGTSKRVRDSRRGGLGPTSAAPRLFLRGSPGGDGQPDIHGRVFMQGGQGVSLHLTVPDAAGFGPRVGSAQARGRSHHNTARWR